MHAEGSDSCFAVDGWIAQCHLCDLLAFVTARFLRGLCDLVYKVNPLPETTLRGSLGEVFFGG
jgi:hypothetical protein